MTSEAVKIAKINRQIALMDTVKQVASNPAVELIVGLHFINGMYPEGSKSTIKATVPAIVSPVSMIKNFFGIGSEIKMEQYTESTSTAEEWARQALLWVIIAQQLAPYAPAIITGVGNTLTGVTGAVGGLLTKAGTK